MSDRLRQQIDELEFLQSMYSAPGEFKIEDEYSYQQAVAYVSPGHHADGAPKTLSCSLHIPISAHQDSDDEDDAEAEEASAPSKTLQYNVDISIRIPNRWKYRAQVEVQGICGYPDTLPEVYVSSNELSRRSQDDLNSELKQFMLLALSPGEVGLLNVVEWIRDNTGAYFPISDSTLVEQNSSDTKENGPDACFCRMWLYMHHIYSKTKRRNILAHADELQLTGFCLPGKPGVVCVEGTSQNTKDFYSILRRWNWKSIACRRKEVVEGMDIDSNRKIQGFQELAFDTHGTRQTHMDMGQFLDYLRTHSLEYMFKELFGVEGHID